MDLDDLLAPSRADVAVPFWIPETVLTLTQKEREGRAAFIEERQETLGAALER